MYRILILEDESDEAGRLMELLKRYGAAHNLTFQITWHSSAMEMTADKSHYDVMLFDIDLPGINGIEAAELIRIYDETTPIIFVTNLAQYAVKGYEVSAVGFIVKPATYGSLTISLDRALRQVRQSVGRTITASSADERRVIALSQIAWIDVRNHSLSFHFEDGEVFQATGTLSQVEKDLEGAPVVRISKSCLVNMDKVERIRTGALHMVTGDDLYLSRGKKKEALNKLIDYLGGR